MWAIKDYRTDDKTKVLELVRSKYGDIEIADSMYFDWQYNDNPAGKVLMKIAETPDMIVGQYAVIPIRVKIDENLVLASLSVNTITRDGYSGQGIFSTLAEAVYSDCDSKGLGFTIGFPNPNSYPIFMSRLGFAEPGGIPLLIKPIRPGALCKKYFGMFPGLLQRPIDGLFAVRSFRPNKFDVTEVDDSNLAEIDDLWRDLQHKYRVIGVRDAEHIKWRYMDIPIRKYSIWIVKSQGELIGYIIGRCTEISGIKCGMIVDFLVKPGFISAGIVLIKKVLNYFWSNGVELCGSLMLDHTEEYRILKHSGFYRCPRFLEPQPFVMIYRPHQGVYPAANIKNWFLTMGDYDAI